ncbi:MAG: hypothetical protein IIB19_07930, partial [Chloroflexi bacterium]|nr:hypothetical protein [Chloroflexota bacterium]
MGRKRTAAQQTTTPKALDRFSKALAAGDDWFAALLEPIPHWETPEEAASG